MEPADSDPITELPTTLKGTPPYGLFGPLCSTVKFNVGVKSKEVGRPDCPKLQMERMGFNTGPFVNVMTSGPVPLPPWIWMAPLEAGGAFETVPPTHELVGV